MNIFDYNETLHEQQRVNRTMLRFVELEPYTRHTDQHVRRFKLEQYCPIIDEWVHMLMPGRWGVNFESDNKTPVPDNKCELSKPHLERLGKLPKCVIVCSGKHGTWYYDGSSTEAIGRTAIHVLKQRAENEEYYALTSHSINQKKPSEPRHKPDDFPIDGEFANLAKKQWEIYEREVAEFEGNVNFRTQFKKAVEEIDYVVAARLLVNRKSYEYESFEIERMIDVD